MKIPCTNRKQRREQSGYVLLVIMLFATMMVIGALAAARLYVGQIKRDQEVEMVHRGAQYSRAIKAYYKKFRRYPANLEQLENTNQVRFLRRRYKDPITGQDFKLVHLGEVQLQPRSGSGTSNPGVPAANLSSAGFQQGDAQAAAQGVPGAQGPASPLTTAAGQPIAGGSAGGAPIVGVESTSKKTSILEFNNKNHYNEWEFVYDPTFDRGGLIRGPYNGASNVGLAGQPGQNGVPNAPPSQRLPGFLQNQGQNPGPQPTPQNPQ